MFDYSCTDEVEEVGKVPADDEVTTIYPSDDSENLLETVSEVKEIKNVPNPFTSDEESILDDNELVNAMYSFPIYFSKCDLSGKREENDREAKGQGRVRNAEETKEKTKSEISV